MKKDQRAVSFFALFFVFFIDKKQEIKNTKNSHSKKDKNPPIFKISSLRCGFGLFSGVFFVIKKTPEKRKVFLYIRAFLETFVFFTFLVVFCKQKTRFFFF